MIAMQYSIDLPADYDMEIIRRRVAERGSFTDEFPGLGLKAYLMTEAGEAGATANRYAPFYLWLDPRGMRAFLWGEGFAGLCGSFGRPHVDTWLGVAFHRGPAFGETPITATREVAALAADAPAADVSEQQDALGRRRSGQPGLHSWAAAIDPTAWRLVRFALWTWPIDQLESEPTRYHVLHLSTPGMERLA
jgi:uncharacterized protein DUF4865